MTARKKTLIIVTLFGVLLLWSFTTAAMIPKSIPRANSTTNKNTTVKPKIFLDRSEDNYTMDYSYVISNSWYVDQAYDAVAGFVTGYTDNGMYVVGAIQQAPNSAYTDMIIQKIDTSGNVIWNTTYDAHGYDDVAKSVCYGNDGKYIYVAGYSVGNNADVNVTLLKINRTDGAIIWVKSWGTSNNKEYGMGVSADSNWQAGYGIYVAGYVNKTTGDSDIVVIKFDVNGNEIWNATYDGSYNDFAEDIHASFKGVVTVAGAVSNGTTYKGILLRYDSSGNLLTTGSLSSNQGSVIFHRLYKPSGYYDYVFVTAQVAEQPGRYIAKLVRADNDTLTGLVNIQLPIGNANSSAYGIITDKGNVHFYVTGYVDEGNNKDEFFWKIDVSSMSTVSVATIDCGHDEIGYGIAGYITTEAQYFYIVAGTQSYNDPNLHLIYYWHVWSPDIDNDGLSNFNEIRKGTNMTNPDSDNDGLQDGAEVYTYLTDPLNNDTDTDNITDGAEVNTYFTNPLSNDTDADNITDWTEIFVYKTNASNIDTDGDNLTDYEEIFTYKTNATNSDTDGDGMPDGWEVQYKFNATNPSDATEDLDNDGLSNVGEYKNGTDPTNPDTDGDGMPDGWEVQYGLNPTNSTDATQDPDNDTVTNIQEYIHHTNPLSNDTDGDGMPDGWEIQYGLNATNPSDAAEDLDNDGITNLQEYLDGTDPTVDNVPPTIKAVWTSPNPPNNATETVIYANVEDSNGLSSVKLTYYINGTEHNAVMAFNSTSGYYYYSLGVLEVNTNVTYFVTATDTAGNTKVSATNNFIVTSAPPASSNPQTGPGEENESTQSGGTSTQFDIMTNMPLLAGLGIAIIAIIVAVIMRKKK